jgi:putative flippase GtrA
MLKAVESIGQFFSVVVPGPLKKYYFALFKYGVFVFGGFFGWIILIVSEQLVVANGLWNGIGFALGLALAIVFTFIYHQYVTFDIRTDWLQRFIKFIPLQIVVAIANWVLSVVATNIFHYPDVPASFVITFFLSIFNFLLTRVLVFKRR